MAKPGPEKKLDPDVLFEAWYNRGDRRTYDDVEAWTRAEQLPDAGGVAARSIRRYAHEYDWERRGDALDEEARRIRDARLANLVARHRAREIEAMASLGVKFMRRLMPSTQERPNPAELQPEDIAIGDFIALAKEFDRMTGSLDRGLGESEKTALEEMERAILEMDAREMEQPALPAGSQEVAA